jgi:Ribbon-helix-helix protein, copG family.
MNKSNNRYDTKRKNVLWVELNDYEKELLDLKVKKSGVSKSQYIRDLICGVCPSEAPTSEFFKMYETVNSTMSEVVKITDEAYAESFISNDDYKEIYDLVVATKLALLTIKTLVMTAKSYSNEDLINDSKGSD